TLPNGDKAIVDIQKLTHYCLNPDHPRGRNKARVFAAASIFHSDAEALREALLGAARSAEAVDEGETRYGRRSAWIVRNGEDLPRLTPRYVLWKRPRKWMSSRPSRSSRYSRTCHRRD